MNWWWFGGCVVWGAFSWFVGYVIGFTRGVARSDQDWENALEDAIATGDFERPAGQLH